MNPTTYSWHGVMLFGLEFTSIVILESNLARPVAVADYLHCDLFQRVKSGNNGIDLQLSECLFYLYTLVFKLSLVLNQKLQDTQHHSAIILTYFIYNVCKNSHSYQHGL